MTTALPPNDFVTCVIRPEESGVEQRTILMTGSSRGGTSMLSATAHDLGISTGKDSGTFEDHKIGKAADAGDWQRVRELVEERNGRNDVWAWKRPALIQYLNEALPLVRNPSVVMIFKDVLAVAHRKMQVRAEEDFATYLLKTASFYQRMARYCTKLKCPLMVVSYEGARRDPQRYTRELAAFLGVTDPARIEHAVEQLGTNQQKYLEIQAQHLLKKDAAYQADASSAQEASSGRTSPWAKLLGKRPEEPSTTPPDR